MMKVVLVGDQTLIRKGLISMLSKQDTIEIAGEAENKRRALSLIQEEEPDLVIVDFHSEKESVLDMITEARQLGCICKFAVLIYSKDPMSFEQAKSLNAEGYISLEAHPEELIYALHVIQRGRKYYDPDIIDLMMQTQSKPSIDNSLLQLLTSKEREILQKLGIGFSNKQIAQTLYITENTVKKHVSQVLSKLDLCDRTQAALYANETGLVQYKHEITHVDVAN